MLLALALVTLGSLAGDEAFDQGVVLYKQLEYEQASARFAEISARPALAAPDKAEALVWLGLCLAGTGDIDAARRTLKGAVLTDANVRLPTATAISPRMQELFDAVLAEAEAAPPPTPPPPPPPPPPAPQAHAPLPLLPAGLVVGGVVVSAGGVVLAVLAAGNLQLAEDPDAFQLDAKAALDAANGEGVAAGVLLVGGAALLGAGIVLFAVGE